MPLPLGHTAIGWAVLESGRREEDAPPLLGRVLLVTLLANLPDLDVLLGLLLHGNGNALHRGPTHSLVFALLAGWAAAQLWRLGPWVPRISFRMGFLLVFSHVAADLLFTSAPVSLFWPLEVNFSGGYSGWGTVLHAVVFRSLQDAGIAAGCLGYLLLLRQVRRMVDGLRVPAVVRRDER